MDSTMTPKIADFGLSRIFGEQKSQTITENRAGTCGYMAPEYLIEGAVSYKADIFSLGVIVIEIITGRRDYPTFQQNNPQSTAASLQQFIEKVVGNWRNKFLSIPKCKSMEIYTKQVHECIAIALRCVDPIMESRPTAKNIIQILNAVQQVIAVSSDLLDVHPLELRIPIEPNKLIKCSLHLTNNNDKQVVFRLIEKRYNWMCFLKLPQYGIVPPRSTYTLFVTTRKNESLPKERSVDLILQSSISEDYVMPFRLGYYCDQYFEKAKMLDNAVHNVALKAIYAQQGETTYEANPPLTQIISLEKTWENYIYSLDFHRKEPWILTRHHHDIDIWNYHTKTLMGSVRTHDFVCSLKFIERKEWFVVTSERNLSRERSRERGLTRERSVSRERNVSIDGFICVYNYKTGVKIIKSFHVGQTEVHGETSLAVHPTKPYVLSACGGWIKLWDWDKNWECIQTSEEQSDYTLHLTFNPNGTNSFASSSKAGEITIWSLDLLKPKYTLYGHSSRVRCLDFFTRDDQQYLITGSADKTAKIWDMQTKECVYTLEGLMSTVWSVFSHPSIPVLITGTEMGDIHLWGAINFRLQKTIRLGEHGSCFIGKCTLSNRVLIVNHSELWIHDEEPDAGHGSNPIEKV